MRSVRSCCSSVPWVGCDSRLEAAAAARISASNSLMPPIRPRTAAKGNGSFQHVEISADLLPRLNVPNDLLRPLPGQHLVAAPPAAAVANRPQIPGGVPVHSPVAAATLRALRQHSAAHLGGHLLKGLPGPGDSAHRCLPAPAIAARLSRLRGGRDTESSLIPHISPLAQPRAIASR